MDGYSVEEAAEVLGIPQGRVWELIARGVLAGAAEGRSDMRVFLKPAAMPSAESSRSGAGRGNGGDGGSGGNGGNGGSHIEASPFRELLTEFRNLTERYGQALLALGEARGEVAALRSRVEVLEARMDMRLPLRSASTVAWELPDRHAPEAAGAPVETTETQAETPTHAPSVAQVAPEPRVEPAAPADVTLPEPPLPGDELVQEVDFAAEADAPGSPGIEAEPEPEAQMAAEPESEAEPAGEVDSQAEAEPEPAPDVAGETDAEPGTMGTESFPDVQFVDPTDTAAEPAREPPRRRVTGGRAAVAGLAEALARAEDPTPADLPGAREAAAALAALQQAVDAPPGAVEHAPPPDAGEPPVDEAMPDEAEPSPAAFAQPMSEVEEEPLAADMPDATEAAGTEPDVEASPQVEVPDTGTEAPSVYSTEVVEPDWFADGDFTWLDASDQPSDQPSDKPPEPEAPSETELQPETEVEPQAEAQPGPASEAEMDHVEREEEAPVVDALQDAFDQSPPAPPELVAPESGAPEAGPEGESESEPEAPGELAHVEREAEAPAVEAIQEAFDEPDATHPTGIEAWPTQDRGSITASGGVGFGLFRSRDDAPRAHVTPAPPPTDEEAILWFGDEFEAGDLEVAAPGWRDQERLDAAPQPEPQPATEATEATEANEAAEANEATEATDSLPTRAPDAPAPTDDEISRLAAQGWDSAEVEAIRSYLGRAPGIAHPQGTEVTGPSTPAHDQDWLRGRRGPAATAYRRLRRLFQS